MLNETEDSSGKNAAGSSRSLNHNKDYVGDDGAIREREPEIDEAILHETREYTSTFQGTGISNF